MSSVWAFLSQKVDSDLHKAYNKCVQRDYKAAAILKHRSTFTCISSGTRFRTFALQVGVCIQHTAAF